jgi:hypothetical protein
MELSRQERLILSLQLRILEKLEPKDAKQLSQNREAIEAGYELEYDHIGGYVDKATLPREECKFVYEVLAMFDALQRAHRTLPDGAGVKAADVQFPGFDGKTRRSTSPMRATLSRTSSSTPIWPERQTRTATWRLSGCIGACSRRGARAPRSTSSPGRT